MTARKATAGKDGTIALWDVAGRQGVGLPLDIHETEIYAPVSYTHLDVYKRQAIIFPQGQARAALPLPGDLSLTYSV